MILYSFFYERWPTFLYLLRISVVSAQHKFKFLKLTSTASLYFSCLELLLPTVSHGTNTPIQNTCSICLYYLQLLKRPDSSREDLLLCHKSVIRHVVEYVCLMRVWTRGRIARLSWTYPAGVCHIRFLVHRNMKRYVTYINLKSPFAFDLTVWQSRLTFSRHKFNPVDCRFNLLSSNRPAEHVCRWHRLNEIKIIAALNHQFNIARFHSAFF